jgi:hypothetical protein
MSNNYGSCKYCHKDLEKTKCPKDTSSIFWLDIFMELWTFSVYIVYLLLSYFSKTINKKEYKSKKIITCNNKDCIDY